MTPKEKAIELRFKFWKFVDIMPEEARQCALIAVDEILGAGIHPFDKMYWEEVKQEIQKL